jgi:hypothetical protein
MKKMRLLAAIMLSAATMVSTVAFAAPAKKDIFKPVTVTSRTITDGIFKSTYPVISGAKDSKADAAINGAIVKNVTDFTAPFNRTAKYGSPFDKIDAQIEHSKMAGTVNYTVACNAKTIISVIMDKNVTVPHKDGKSYSLELKDGINYTIDGTVLKADDWSKMAKAVNMEDPFSEACLKKSVDAALAAKGLEPVKNYEKQLGMAKEDYYIDANTNLHALYFPGLIAPESAGWFDVILNMSVMK